jgi:hypothetical protein
MVSDLLDGPSHPLVARVDPERTQERERGFRGGPGLALVLGRVAGGGSIPPAPREERACVPLTVVALQGQQPRAPSLGATRARSAATTSTGASARSRSVCHRIEGSPSSIQSNTVKRRVYGVVRVSGPGRSAA